MKSARGGIGGHTPAADRDRHGDDEATGERPIVSISPSVGRGNAHARFEARMISGDVLDVRVVGFLTHAGLRAGHQKMEALIVAAERPVLLMRDVLAMDGFEPGVPIAAVRWAEQYKAQITRAAWVVRRSSMVSVARTFELLIPGMPQSICSTRQEALAFLKGKG